MGRRNANSPPAQSPVRCRQAFRPEQNMKESLRHNYQVTIIGGVIVLIIGAIVTPPITKYFMNTESNIQPKTDSLQQTMLEPNSGNKTKKENINNSNAPQNISSNIKTIDHKQFPEKQNSTNIYQTQPIENQNLPALAIPELLHPDNNAEFNYPRHVLLQWSEIPNAVSYEIQVEILVLETNEWKDLNKFFRGGTTKYFDDTVRDGTSLYFTGVGAQPHRWRVKAIGQEGRESKYSEWRYIIFNN
jgi:hypothetical protein